MPALVAGIHALLDDWQQDVDGRVKPGHDVEGVVTSIGIRGTTDGEEWSIRKLLREEP